MEVKPVVKVATGSLPIESRPRKPLKWLLQFYGSGFLFLVVTVEDIILLPSRLSSSTWCAYKDRRIRSLFILGNSLTGPVSELADMMSASKGGGGHGKADVVVEVCVNFIPSVRSKCGRGGEGSKYPKFCEHHSWKLPCHRWLALQSPPDVGLITASALLPRNFR